MRGNNLLDVAAQVISSLVGRSCYFALQVVLARVLGPQAFGVFAIGWTVFALISGIAPFGMPQAVIRFEFAGRGVLRSKPLALASLIGAACLVALILVAELVARVAFREREAAFVILALAPSVLLLCIFGVLCAALRSARRNVASALLDASFFVLYLVVTLILFETPSARTPSAAGWAYDFAMVVATAVAFVLCWRIPGENRAIAVRPLISFGFVTMIIHTASLLNLQVDRLIIGVYAGAREVGLYQAASQIAMVAIVFRVAVQRVFEARVPKAGKGSTAEVTQEFVASSRILLHICAPGLVCLALSAGTWTALLFGSAYAGAAGPLAILVLGQLVQSFAGPSLTALHMMGAERTAMTITLSAFVINAIGNLALFPHFGLVGSALATSAASVMLGLASVVWLRRTGRLAPISKAMFDIMAGIGLASIPPVVALELGLASVPSMLCVVAVSYLAYGLSVSLLRDVEDEAFDLAATGARKLYAALLKRTMRRLPHDA